MLKTKVKASQITNLTDARYFAAMGVDWLGFSLDPAHPNHVPPKSMQEMAAWLEGPSIIGEYSMATPDTIRESYDILGLDFIQIGHFHTVEHAKALNGIPVIKEIVPDSLEDLYKITKEFTGFMPYVSMFLLDLSKNGLPIEQEQQVLEQLSPVCKAFPVLLQLNTGAAFIQEIIQDVNPIGISVVGGEEEAVGVKSFDELDELFDVLLVEE